MAINIAQSGRGPGGVGTWRIEVEFNPNNQRLTAPLRVIIEGGNFYVWSAVTTTGGTRYARNYGPGPGTCEQPVPTGQVRVVPDGEGGYSYNPVQSWEATAVLSPRLGDPIVAPQ